MNLKEHMIIFLLMCVSLSILEVFSHILYSPASVPHYQNCLTDKIMCHNTQRQSFSLSNLFFFYKHYSKLRNIRYNIESFCKFIPRSQYLKTVIAGKGFSSLPQSHHHHHHIRHIYNKHI